MNVQLDLQEITEAYGTTYNSIDVRTVALRLADRWINTLTVIRVGYESPEMIKSKHDELKSLHVLPELEDFRIFLSSRPFSDWPRLCADLKNSAGISHGDVEVKLTAALDILSKTGYVSRQHNVLKALPWDWPTCEISFEYRPSEAEQSGLGDRVSLLLERKLNQRISQFAHSSVFDAIDAFMELTLSFSRNSNPEFHVSVPIFAAIDAVEIKPIGNVICASARFHERLPNVRFFAVCKYSPQSSGLLPKATLPLQIHDADGQTNDGVRRVLANVTLPQDIQPSDFVEVKVVSDLGDIDTYQGEIHTLQPARYVHPLYHALTAFRAEEELRQGLTYPQARQVPKSQPWNL
jgi:hypothetical protein